MPGPKRWLLGPIWPVGIDVVVLDVRSWITPRPAKAGIYKSCDFLLLCTVHNCYARDCHFVLPVSGRPWRPSLRLRLRDRLYTQLGAAPRILLSPPANFHLPPTTPQLNLKPQDFFFFFFIERSSTFALRHPSLFGFISGSSSAHPFCIYFFNGRLITFSFPFRPPSIMLQLNKNR